MNHLGLIGFPALTLAGLAGALGATRADRPRAYLVAKTAASVGFVGTVLAVGALGASWSRVVAVGAVLALLGDVVLALAWRRSFIAGLGCFAAAHSLYAAGFALHGVGTWQLIAFAGAVAALTAAGAWQYLYPHLPGKMRVPVAAYLLVVGSMLAVGAASGIAHGSWTLAAGAVLVAGSDILVGREAFVASSFANKAIGLPMYYLGQLLIVLSLGAR